MVSSDFPRYVRAAAPWTNSAILANDKEHHKSERLRRPKSNRSAHLFC